MLTFFFFFAAPSAPPVEFSCRPSVSSPDSLSFMWVCPPMDMLNGIIRGYTIMAHPVNLSEEVIEMTVPGNLTSFTINNLTSMTFYMVLVRAVTVAPGPPATITCLTGTYPPTVPLLEQSRYLDQNLPLIIFSYFCQICKNVLLLDQKSCFFADFVPLFASGRLVGMQVHIYYH